MKDDRDVEDFAAWMLASPEVSCAEARAAAVVICGRARNAEDAVLLLGMCGLT